MQFLSIKIGFVLIISSLAITVFTACEKTTDATPQLMRDLTKSDSGSGFWSYELPIPEQYYVAAEDVNLTTATSEIVTWENTGETFELQVEMALAFTEGSVGMHSIIISGETSEDFRNALVFGPIDDFVDEVIVCAEGCKSHSTNQAINKCLNACFFDTLRKYIRQQLI